MLLSGIVLGLFIALMVGLYLQERRAMSSTHDDVRDTRSDPVNQPSPTPPAAESKYEFYGALPATEVVVPKNEGIPSDSLIVQDDLPAGSSGGRYNIQAGSFTRADGAEEQKARLAMLGFEADIKSTKLHDGRVVYRVLLGPFDDLESVNQVRTRLLSDKIANSVLKAE